MTKPARLKYTIQRIRPIIYTTVLVLIAWGGARLCADTWLPLADGITPLRVFTTTLLFLYCLYLGHARKHGVFSWLIIIVFTTLILAMIKVGIALVSPDSLHPKNHISEAGFIDGSITIAIFHLFFTSISIIFFKTILYAFQFVRKRVFRNE